MSPEVQRAMEGQFQRFREKFGKDPGPHDPVFFDPDANTPQELDWDRVDFDIVDAMVKAGIEPEKIYAYRKTGFKGGYALHSRLPHILWLADPPTAHVLYHL